MALINTGAADSGKAGGAPVAVDKKASKAEAAKRHAEKVARQKKEFFETALAFRDELVKSGQMEKLSQKSKDFIANACRDPKDSAQPVGGTSLFITLFGADAQPGKSITLLDAFKKVQLAKGAFEKKFKEWETKGNKPAKIEIIPNADVMSTTYKVVSVNL
jgi:hypothetical protein